MECALIYLWRILHLKQQPMLPEQRTRTWSYTLIRGQACEVAQESITKSGLGGPDPHSAHITQLSRARGLNSRLLCYNLQYNYECASLIYRFCLPCLTTVFGMLCPAFFNSPRCAHASPQSSPRYRRSQNSPTQQPRKAAKAFP